MIPTIESCNVLAVSATMIPSSCSPSNENGAGGNVISPRFTSSRLWAAAKLCNAFNWWTLFVSFWIIEIASSVCTPVEAIVRPADVTSAVDVSDGEGVQTSDCVVKLSTCGSTAGKVTLADIPRLSATLADVSTCCSVCMAELTLDEKERACASDWRSAGVRFARDSDDVSETGTLGK